MTDFPTIAKMLCLGLGAGVLSGMFGIGGGLVIVPALILMFGFDIKTAVGTSLLALIWPVGALAVREYYLRNEMRVMLGLMIACGLFLGAPVGAKLTGLISAGQMKRAYGIFLLVIGVYLLWTAGSPANLKRPTKAAPAPSATRVAEPPTSADPA